MITTLMPIQSAAMFQVDQVRSLIVVGSEILVPKWTAGDVLMKFNEVLARGGDLGRLVLA